ncbi:uncharacterized protein LOC111252676 [Varroa destructor]|uniref:BTB domain-containing protein n=1 Tax=Varroa destructor TaxID=109461 RepID=A0A7M7KJ34_VARDE|nr:uncharacterized protein LOC111252676 [Varroa destructor]XP_022666682.1 uncharacterized protein LOC111252676 [Varroa destructor]XP_022666683.1 uncharacterized protein LOC111252676 [Varroa destructor]XP_022666684.1 uncharacterized protein LOC111252676 [Varroa destructor]XP_022666685.1 uncharacterized protein LOC111252676 [Varroa destructor]
MRRLVHHCRRLLTSLKEQRIHEPLLCDLTLLTSDEQLLRCHKAVLCANSSYFNAMLTSNFIEACQSEVQVPFASCVLSPVVDFFYDGCIELRVNNSLDLLETADMLLAQDLIAECESYISQHLLEVLTDEKTLKKDSLFQLVPVLKKQVKFNLKGVLGAIHRWFVEDAHTRLMCFTELQLAVINRLQDDFEVRLIEDNAKSQHGNEVYVNFQNIEHAKPNLLKFDGAHWSKCDWPQADDLPYSCEHFCIVEYGKSLLYCKTQGESIQLREKGQPDRIVEGTSGTLMSFLKSERQIFLHKISRTGDRLKIFDRIKKCFHTVELPKGYKLIKVSENRITENIINNEIFIVATLRIQEILQEGMFCFDHDPKIPWVVTRVSQLPHKSCERDIPTVFCNVPVILSAKDCRAYVLHRIQLNDTDHWQELLSFPLVELDPANYELIYVYSTRRKLYLVVEQDQEVRVICYKGLQATRQDVTVETQFPRARLDYERGVIFADDE